jgi:hypothetical protein
VTDTPFKPFTYDATVTIHGIAAHGTMMRTVAGVHKLERGEGVLAGWRNSRRTEIFAWVMHNGGTWHDNRAEREAALDSAPVR